MKLNFYWHNYKYLSYERALAARELEVFFGQHPTSRPDGLAVDITDGSEDWRKYALRTTYFREVVTDMGEYLIPTQAVLEASANGGLQENLPGAYMAPLLHRQSTRYGAHGIHEYRGKFNPQIVRAIGNLLRLNSGDWLLDPFCGSGTTLLEAAHNGWNAIGIDINPLGVEIAQAKLAALRIDPEALTTYGSMLRQNLNQCITGIPLEMSLDAKQIRRIGGTDWEIALPNLDYLRAWFTDSVLVQLAAILKEIGKIPDQDMQRIARVILSDIVRGVSLQDPADLRIRRRKSPPANMPAIPLFLDSLSARIETIVKIRRVFQPDRSIVQDVLLGDTRKAATVVSKAYPERLFHAAITSPPYVTALPYIDTQRLSLTVLGLIAASELRPTEERLIGNREVTNRQRLLLEDAIRDNAHGLPEECWRLCCEMKATVDRQTDGFRRQNNPALVYQYFRDMALMFGQVRSLLYPKARFALVVGANQTRLGGKQFVIDTPHLLTLLAQQQGFRLAETFELNTYQRFDVHQANSIRSETMLVLEAVPYAD